MSEYTCPRCRQYCSPQGHGPGVECKPVVMLADHTPYFGVPYVGCGATIPVGSDCYPGTVVWVSKATVDVDGFDMPKKIRIRECDYSGVPGHSNAFTENQKYEYFESEDLNKTDAGTDYTWREKRKGYVRVGVPSKRSDAQRPGFGFRRAYRDPSF